MIKIIALTLVVPADSRFILEIEKVAAGKREQVTIERQRTQRYSRGGILKIEVFSSELCRQGLQRDVRGSLVGHIRQTGYVRSLSL
jgi:hypothetical protein